MYPKIYLNYFRDFERTDEVFVAMPFTDDFNSRWKSIFRPAIKSTKLEPYRVDVRKISDSILTDILNGIGRARFILIDTSFQKVRNQSTTPNANVMYELGIAHAMRLPEEVIVVRDRSSKDPTPFDIGHIRYSYFDGKNMEAGKSTVENLIIDAQKAIDLTRDIIVKRTLRSLDPDSLRFLGRIGANKTFDLYPFDPDRKGLYYLGDRDSSEGELRSIARRLIDVGLLESGNPGPPEKQVYGAVPEYKVTLLGKAVWKKLPDWWKKSSI